MKPAPGMVAVGVVSMVIGVSGIVLFVGLSGAHGLQAALHWQILAQTALSISLFVVGLGLLRLRRWTLALSWTYVLGQLVLVATIVKDRIGDIAHRPWIVEPWMCEPPQLGGLPMTIDLVLTVVLLAAWPIALAVILSRRPVREQLRW